MNHLFNSIAGRYSRQGLWSLFLVCAFPFHLWTLILVFRDMDWVINRTNVWDAVGVGSYGLVFAFLESLTVFVVMALLGLFTPTHWDTQRRIAFVSLLVLMLSAWAIFVQPPFIRFFSPPSPALRLVIASKYPFGMLYGIYLAFVTLSVLFPVYLFLRSNRFVQWIQDMMGRLSTLMGFYLAFDLIGLVIVIIRNVS